MTQRVFAEGSNKIVPSFFKVLRVLDQFWDGAVYYDTIKRDKEEVCVTKCYYHWVLSAGEVAVIMLLQRTETARRAMKVMPPACVNILAYIPLPVRLISFERVAKRKMK